MPFELGKAFNGGVEWVCSSTLVYNGVKNPILTALIITTLTLVVVFLTYRRNLRGTGWKQAVKLAFWMTAAVSVLIFVHYYALNRSLRKANSSQGLQNAMASIHTSAAIGGGYSVTPRDAGDAGNVGNVMNVGNVGNAMNERPLFDNSRSFGAPATFVRAPPTAPSSGPELTEVVLDTMVIPRLKP